MTARGIWGLDEPSGSTAIDDSGLGNDGTISGSVSRVSGQHGGALRFTGSGGVVTVANHASLRISGAITVACWTRPENTGTADIVSKSVLGSIDGYELVYASSTIPFFRVNQATSGDTYRANALSAVPQNGSTWVHLAGTYDGTNLRLYVNGTLVSTVTGPASIGTSSTALALGAHPGGTRPYRGYLDDVRIYAEALTAEQIATVMAGGEPGGAYDGTASLSATASITSTRVLGKVAAASLTSAATPTASGSVVAAAPDGAATLTVTGILAAAGMRGTISAGTLTASGSITASGSLGVARTAALTGTATLTATGVVGGGRTATVASTATVAATGVVVSGGSATASVTGTATVIATGQVALTSTATLAAGVVLTATHLAALSAAAALTGTASITAAGFVYDPTAPVVLGVTVGSVRPAHDVGEVQARHHVGAATA